jgi:outer membrane protein TolC
VRRATTTAAFPAASAALSAVRPEQLAIENRPELHAAAWAVAALRQDWKATLLERLPTMSIAASGS